MTTIQNQRADIIAKAINTYCPSVINEHFRLFVEEYQSDINVAIKMDEIIHEQSKKLEKVTCIDDFITKGESV
jgi:hypothetical protein